MFIDIYTINDDGNLIDASGIAAVAALRDAKMPKYDEEKEKVIFGEFTTKKIPLAKDPIIPITFYKIGDEFIVDPTREEEDISETRITIGSCDGIISSMQKGDITPVKIEEISKILDSVEKIWKEIFKKLEKFLK